MNFRPQIIFVFIEGTNVYGRNEADLAIVSRGKQNTSERQLLIVRSLQDF